MEAKAGQFRVTEALYQCSDTEVRRVLPELTQGENCQWLASLIHVGADFEVIRVRAEDDRLDHYRQPGGQDARKSLFQFPRTIHLEALVSSPERFTPEMAM